MSFPLGVFELYGCIIYCGGIFFNTLPNAANFSPFITSRVAVAFSMSGVTATNLRKCVSEWCRQLT